MCFDSHFAICLVWYGLSSVSFLACALPNNFETFGVFEDKKLTGELRNWNKCLYVSEMVL